MSLNVETTLLPTHSLQSEGALTGPSAFVLYISAIQLTCLCDMKNSLQGRSEMQTNFLTTTMEYDDT